PGREHQRPRHDPAAPPKPARQVGGQHHRHTTRRQQRHHTAQERRQQRRPEQQLTHEDVLPPSQTEPSAQPSPYLLSSLEDSTRPAAQKESRTEKPHAGQRPSSAQGDPGHCVQVSPERSIPRFGGQKCDPSASTAGATSTSTGTTSTRATASDATAAFARP